MERPAPVKLDPRAALELFEKGQDYFEAGRFHEAGEMFKQAVVLDPVNPEIVAWQSKTAARLEEERQQEADHTVAVEAFRNRDFETALRKFYRLEQKNPGGPYETYIVTAWYNWGLQLLAAGNLREADRKMDEVLTLRPNDENARGVKILIADYVSRAKDRIFYARIEALRYRVIEG